MKLFLAMALALACLLTPAQSGEKPIRIGAVLLDVRHEWFLEIIEGMKDAEKDCGARVAIRSSDSDLTKESAIIDSLVSGRFDAITISPQSDEGSIPAFERAVAAGIPIVAWNSRVASNKARHFIGVDNVKLGRDTGRYAADFIRDTLGGKAKIVVIGTTRFSVGQDRVRGFLEEVRALPGVEILDIEDAEFRETGASATERILEEHPKTQILWCWNQGTLLGALETLKTAKRADVVLMGTDMSIDLARAMLEPGAFLQAVTTQQPHELGYQVIRAAADLVRGGEVPAEILVPLRTYTLDDREAIRKYLDDRRYLQ